MELLPPLPDVDTLIFLRGFGPLKMIFLGHVAKPGWLKEGRGFIEFFLFSLIERFGSFVSLLSKSGIPFLGI